MTWVCCREPGHLIFPPEEPGKPACPGCGTNGLLGIWERGNRCFRLSQDHTRAHTNTRTNKRRRKEKKGSSVKFSVFLL